MTILKFHARPTKPERFRIELRKGKQSRLFEIIPNVGAEPTWQSWMRHNGHPLRALVTRDPLIVQQLRTEYEREIAVLRADGWT
jgi:hypothetical protein